MHPHNVLHRESNRGQALPRTQPTQPQEAVQTQQTKPYHTRAKDKMILQMVTPQAASHVSCMMMYDLFLPSVPSPFHTLVTILECNHGHTWLTGNKLQKREREKPRCGETNQHESAQTQCYRSAMAGWLHGVFVGEFVSFKICNYP